MTIFSNPFKSNYRIVLENTFKPLENLGFKRKYNYYGFEQVLTYTSKEIKVALIWDSQDSNPWINLTIGKIEIDLSYIRKLLLKDIPEDYSSSPRQNYWINKLVPREIYLNIFLVEIIKQLKLDGI